MSSAQRQGKDAGAAAADAAGGAAAAAGSRGAGAADEKSAEAEQDAFVNKGYARWKVQRAEWCKLNREGDADYDSDFLDDMDEEEIFTCLRKYRRFQAPVPLGAMVELLNVLWEEE